VADRFGYVAPGGGSGFLQAGNAQGLLQATGRTFLDAESGVRLHEPRSLVLSVLDRLSFQLYSARKFPPLDRQLETLARLGFRNVEPYGGLLDHADALKAGLQRHGLKAPSTHVSLDRLRSDLAGFIEQARALGVGLVIVPAIPPQERPGDAEGWKKLGREVAKLQEALAKDGLALAWHNHDFEFRKLPDGSIPLDRIFEAASGLLWEADIGWIHAAGEDPIRWLEKYRERIKAVHIKDAAPPGQNMEEDGWTDIGAGAVDWTRLMPALMATNADLLVLEHDNPADFEGFARRSRAAMASW
jgi:sugar phosphate isomerase/epimerase